VLALYTTRNAIIGGFKDKYEITVEIVLDTTYDLDALHTTPKQVDKLEHEYILKPLWETYLNTVYAAAKGNNIIDMLAGLADELVIEFLHTTLKYFLSHVRIKGITKCEVKEILKSG